MSALSAQHNAINLSQGFPDFPVSTELIDLVNHYMTTGQNQYAPMPGVLELRQEISLLQKEFFNASYSPENEITITAGATQGVFTAISATVNPGDEVILFSPSYDCYAPAVELYGGTPVFVPLNSEDYSIDWNTVEKAVSAKTKVILINSPHNPTGSIITKDDLAELSRISRENDLLVISDEVYAHIVFDGREHCSVAMDEELFKRSFVIHSFGKTFHATGWKMGYVLAPQMMMDEFRKVHQYLVFSVNTPIQYALAKYIRNRENIHSLATLYEKKRDLFLDGIKKSRFKFKPAKGSYFQLLDYSEITSEADVDLAVKLTTEFGLASIPISVFYPDNKDSKKLRFCFAKQDHIIEKAIEILCRI